MTTTLYCIRILCSILGQWQHIAGNISCTHQVIDPLGYHDGTDRQVPGNSSTHICSKAPWRKWDCEMMHLKKWPCIRTYPHVQTLGFWQEKARVSLRWATPVHVDSTNQMQGLNEANPEISDAFHLAKISSLAGWNANGNFMEQTNNLQRYSAVGTEFTQNFHFYCSRNCLDMLTLTSCSSTVVRSEFKNTVNIC